MLLLYKYDIFWAFLIISSVISIFAFIISGVLAPISKRLEKIYSYELGIEPMGDAWLQFRICYYMFALVFVVFDVETFFLYPWAMSFDVLGVSIFIKALIFVLILIVGTIYVVGVYQIFYIIMYNDIPVISLFCKLKCIT